MNAITRDKALKLLLNEPYWLPTLETSVQYLRFEDDSPKGFISVMFGPDADGYIMVAAEMDPNEHKWSMRFRLPIMGGGQSPRVRNALLILAEAIRQDNLDHPQRR